MPTRIDHARTQWAGGQGFFHSGTVGIGVRTVLYVYDCGSLQPASLTREINEFRFRCGDEIDLLFLSHFHFDHVSGLPELLAGATVRTAVIPLVSTAERLFVFAHSLSSGADIPAWYGDLVVDPVSFIEDIAAGVEVIGVQPLQDDDDSSDTVGELDPPELGPTGAGIPDNSPGVRLAAGRRSVLAGSNGTVPIWVWDTMTTAFAQKREEAFLDTLATELGIVRSDLDKLIGTRSGIAQLIGSHTAALTTAYDKTFPDMNLSSLIVYSGPASELQRVGLTYRNRSVVERGEVHAWSSRPGWLGTGDQKMGTRRCAAMVVRFGSQLRRVGTLSLPHHGSFDSFHSDLLSVFGDYRPVCSASVGENNTYSHPSRQVLIGLSSNGNHAVIITEHQASRWTESGVTFI